MHERSLARNILAQAEAIAAQQAGGRVREVRVQAGPLSGVEPLLLQSAFEELAHRAGGTARLVVEEVPLVARCPCGCEFEVVGFDFLCPRCGDGLARVIQGEDLQLVSITVDGQVQGEEPDGNPQQNDCGAP